MTQYRMVNVNKEQKRILILAEKQHEEVAPITFELLGVGREIANGVRGILCVAVLGHKIDNISHKIAHFSDEVYSLDNILLKAFQVDLYTYALENLCREIQPILILMGHTFDNVALAPKLAYRMKSQIITDCIYIAIEPETEHLLCTKPVYGAKFLSTFKLEKKPYMATLRPKAVDPIRSGSIRGTVIPFELVVDKSLAKVELIEKVKEESIRLDEAEAIVSGGRGIKNVEGLKLLEELIKVLRNYFNRVELGVSRPLIDLQLAPSSRQIGLTGEKVAPELYIAIGISGSLQHVTGVSRAKKIIAINTDPKANIFKVADYGVVGNFEEVLPALARKLEELRRSNFI